MVSKPSLMPWVEGPDGRELSYPFLRAIENALHFDTNPIYALALAVQHVVEPAEHALAVGA